jgi:phosphoglycolate phosphatase
VADGPAAGPFKLVVFDLDGTLVDTRHDLAQSTNALIGELGGTTLDEALIGSMVGHGVAVWLERALALAGITPFPPGALDRFIAIYDVGLLNHTRAYAGIPEALEQARGRAPLAVLTNKLRGATLKILEGLDLAKFFSEVGGVDGPYPPKPAPDSLLALMQRAGATPAETLLVGDSPVDWHTARNAGARICVARYGFGYVQAPPGAHADGELFIETPSELARILG